MEPSKAGVINPVWNSGERITRLSITNSVNFFFGNDGDGGIEKIIIQRFCFLSEKAVESVDGRQESKGLSVEFMD